MGSGAVSPRFENATDDCFILKLVSFSVISKVWEPRESVCTFCAEAVSEIVNGKSLERKFLIEFLGYLF